MSSKIRPNIEAVGACARAVLEAFYQYNLKRGSIYYRQFTELIEVTTAYFIGYMDCFIGEHVYQI